MFFSLVVEQGYAIVYTWNTQVAGNLAYTNGNMSATISNTAFDTRGPQDPNGGAGGGYKSPKYVSAATINTYQGGSTNDYGMPGLVLGLDWTNLNSSTTLAITFLNPVAGPVSFNLYDVNIGSWGGNTPVWIDKLTITGTDCAGTTIYPAITGCANNISGANNNVLTGTMGCTNNTNTITFNATAVKTISIVYSSGNPLASGYGTDPDPQYVIVSDITAANLPPLTINPAPAVLTCTSPTVTLSTSPALPTATYTWSGGSTPTAATTTVNAAGSYAVTVTDAATGCSLSATTTVTSAISSPIVSINPDTLVITCGMAGGALAAQTNVAGPKYSWSNGDTIANIVAVIPGTYSVTVTDQTSGCSASAVSIVRMDTVVPGGQILPPDTLTCSQPNIVLTATSPASNVLFIWGSGLGVGATKTVSAAGQYTLLIKDLNNGCISRDTVQVFQIGVMPDASILTPDSLTCTTSVVHLQAATPAQPAQYSWSNGSSGASTTVSLPGTYNLIVTDPLSGCADTSAVTVTQNISAPSLTLNTPPTLDCATTSVTLIAGTNVPAAAFAWSNGIVTGTQQVSQPGTYSVTVTDPGNGCTATLSTTVNQTAVPPTVNIGSSGSLGCLVSSVTLTATTSTSGAGFAWSTGSTASTTTVTAAGLYSVTVTDPGSGCSASATNTVTASAVSPTVTITNPDTLTCVKLSVVLTATSATATDFVWNTGAHAASITVAQPGIYVVTATETGSGCTGSANTTVEQNIQSPIVSITPADTLTCTVNTVMLTAASPVAAGTYQWSTGSNQPMAPATAAGVYSVTLTDQTNGCSFSASATVNSRVQVPLLTVNDGLLTCADTVVTLMATGTALEPVYTWSTGLQGQTLSTSQSGSYVVTVTDITNGCSASAQAQVTAFVQPPVVLISGNTVLTEQQPATTLTVVSGGAGISYQWSTGTSGNAISVTEPGPYTVTAFENGCTANASVVITRVINHHLYVPNAFTPNGDGKNDFFQLYGDLEHIAFLEMQVFNRWGEKVFESNDHQFQWDGAYKGLAQTGAVFVWVLKIAYTDGQTETVRKGSVTLFR